LSIGFLAVLSSLPGYVSDTAQTWINTYGIPDPFQVFRGEVWRLAWGPLMHLMPIHLVTNMVFLVIFGTRCERVTSWHTTLGVFAGGVLVGQIVEVHLSQLGHGTVGISGGVSALYGFLLLRDGRMRHPGRSLGSWALLVVWPFMMVGSYYAHVTRIMEFSNFNHVAGVLFGAVAAQWSWRVSAGVVALTLATLIWSPWLSVWRAAHGLLPNVEILDQLPREPPTEPEMERRVYVFNAAGGLKRFYWIDAQGEEHFEWSTRRSAATHFTGRFAIFPRALSNRWAIRDGSGRLLAAFDVSGNPNSALVLDLALER
jgi:membrane associated rhomboid family serine protease